MKYLMCNLKTSKNAKEILEYKKKLEDYSFNNIEFVLFPSSLFLGFFLHVPYKLGSQNISIYQEGNHTGEILARQLSSLKVSYCLINHAEAKEKTKNCIKKIKNATKKHMKVVLCIGEKKKKNPKKTKKELCTFLKKIYNVLEKEERQNCILAYEPYYMIGTQEALDKEILSRVSREIKDFIRETYQQETEIVYGGGITLKNIENLAKVDTIDGFLIGNFANNPENISQILEKI